MEKRKSGEARNEPERPGPRSAPEESANVRPSEKPVPERKPEPTHLPE